MAATDPYRVLGLEPGASQAEVKRAYRRLAKALHPDAAGEGALPAFLALQDAYEQLTGTKVRTASAPGAAASTGTGASREPWRADPARARAAREQARARRGWPGGQPGSGAGAATGPASGARASGGARAGGRPPAGSTPSGGASGGQPNTGSRAGGRRRSTRKATLGSTSYDEARDPADPSWAGASWYGPTTGEYWIVNPREYADPRKHGPGYTSRGRTGGATPADAMPGTGDAARQEDVAPPPPMHSPTAERAASFARGRAAAPPADERPQAASSGAYRAAAGIDAALGTLGRPFPADPIRRLGLVLMAWPPLGIAAASVIGGLTGCLGYSTSCDGVDPLLPWLAQAIILGVLLLVPLLARMLAAGTVGALVALVPATALLTALGGTGSPAAPPALAGWLGIAWLIGVGWGIRHAARAAP